MHAQPVQRQARLFAALALLVVLPLLAGLACQAVALEPSPTPVGVELSARPTGEALGNRPTAVWTASPPLPTPTATPSATPTPTSTPTLTLTPIPTYIILRGQVLVRSNCRYGPGAPYLYKYGLVAGSNLEVIGRTDLGTWILVRAIGGDNPCWVKATLMDVKGDIMNVAPTYIPLPLSPYYAPPKWVIARRDGDEVTIYWKSVQYRAGDETAEAPYLVEAWICAAGQLVFTPIGSYETQIKVIDEAGCSEPSHGRLYFVEKHGYSRWLKIPWPAHE